jgi:tetratricopeptide (TPR) repeat protein
MPVRMPGLALAAAPTRATQSAQAAAPAVTTFDAAAALYKNKQYAAAAAAFQKLLQAEPKNAAAALYLAHSYLANGQMTQAKTYYSWLSKNFPNTPQGQASAAMELKLGISSQAGSAGTQQKGDSANGQTDQAPAATNSQNQNKSGPNGQGQSRIDANNLTDNKKDKSSKKEKFDISKMIRVVRPAMNHPACTPEFVAQIKEGLNACPEHVLQFCAENGCRICITPSLEDRNPELRNTKPRGYEEGQTYKNTPAMFAFPEVVVCQYSQVGDNEDNMQPNDDGVGALRHEFGHAVDHYLDYISNSEEFKHIYYLDRAKIADKDALAYYIQEGTEHGGASETFAQACCIIFGGDTSTSRAKRDVLFKQAFGDVIEYVRKKLNSL